MIASRHTTHVDIQMNNVCKMYAADCRRPENPLLSSLFRNSILFKSCYPQIHIDPENYCLSGSQGFLFSQKCMHPVCSFCLSRCSEAFLWLIHLNRWGKSIVPSGSSGGARHCSIMLLDSPAGRICFR